MPAIDQCEPAVINALQKAGWDVVERPFSIRVDRTRRTYIYADLKLHRLSNNQSIIITEVKCFTGDVSLFEEFYHAVGQFVTYREALIMAQNAATLYLVVPSTIYPTFFQTQLIQNVVASLQIKLIVIDMELEEVVAWIPS